MLGQYWTSSSGKAVHPNIVSWDFSGCHILGDVMQLRMSVAKWSAFSISEREKSYFLFLDLLAILNFFPPDFFISSLLFFLRFFI